MMDVDQFGPAPIAIVGMSGRFPGAASLEEFWENLRDGQEAIRDLSDDELRRRGADPALLAQPNYVKRAAVLDQLDQFDAAFFGMSPRDGAIMDPQHRLFLEMAWEAMEDAGIDPDRFPGSAGVFAGSGTNTYLLYHLWPNRELMESAGLFLIKQTGNDKDVLATRVSYQMNLRGPSMTVQTACSTSLVAVHLASQSLLNHECDLALAGGISIDFPHGIGYQYREGEILSPDGRCRAFDADSAGTVFGSGGGLVVLRRLEDALSDGHEIYAVIRGTAVNNDGSRKAGYLAPSVVGQTEVVAEALAISETDPDTISYVETHGTGTLVGDPIEVKALSDAYRKKTARTGYCGIGSLKTNIGHLDAAAGVASLIKVVLALRHRALPPSLHFRRPNPLLKLEDSPFYVNDRLRDWPETASPRRAGVTSLGIGGTNAHAIVEEAGPIQKRPLSTRPLHLLPLSAKTSSACAETGRRLAEFLDRNPAIELADAAFTWQQGRKSFSQRWAIVATDRNDAVARLREDQPHLRIEGVASERFEPVFLFSGQGTQYPLMGAQIYRNEPVFRAALDRCCDLLRSEIALDLRTILYPEPGREGWADNELRQTGVTQPALFTLEYALTELWRSWGIRPTAMIGHSLGEYVAACLAGVFNLETALQLVAYRGRLIQSLPAGAMVALEATDEELADWLDPETSVATINSPSQRVISGSFDAVGRFTQTLDRHQRPYTTLATSHAFHSRMMDDILEPFSAYLGKCRLSAPRIPFVSNVTGTWATPEEVSRPEYWIQHLRGTVRFADGLKTLSSRGPGVLLEIGPGRVLGGLARRHPEIRKETTILGSLPAQREAGEDQRFIWNTLARLWTVGAPVNWDELYRGEARARLRLPFYPFERRRHWFDLPSSKSVTPATTPAESVRAQTDTGDLRVYAPVWQKRSPVRSRSVSGTWLVFQDSLGLGDRLAAQRVGKIVQVRPGKGFRKISAREYQIAPANPEDYRRLLTDYLATYNWPEAVLNLWPVMSPAATDQTHLTELCFYSSLFLTQALGAHGSAERVRVATVSNHLVSVQGEPIHLPQRAVLAGPNKAVPLEYPAFATVWVDLPWDGPRITNRDRWVTRLIDELEVTQAGKSVALRDPDRWEQLVATAQLADQSPGARLRPGGVYVITGGMSGIGFAVAEYLARQTQAKLVLIDRTGSANANDERRRKISHLENLGAEVLSLAADVANESQLRDAVAGARAKFHAIHGVIHSAGVLRDGLIHAKDPVVAEQVLRPKVAGTTTLLREIDPASVDFVILFSSISSYLPPAGQIDYIAANSALDTVACALHAQGKTNVIALDWARWREVGMATRSLNAATVRIPPALKQVPFLGRQVRQDAKQAVYVHPWSVDRDWIVAEHRMKDGPGLFPGTGYIALAAAAAREEFGTAPVLLRNVAFNAPFMAAPGESNWMRTSIRKDGDEMQVTIAAGLPDGSGDQLACAAVSVQRLEDQPEQTIPLTTIEERCQLGFRRFTAELQNEKQAHFIHFGSRWRCLKSIGIGDHEALAYLELPEAFVADLEEHPFHPALADAATGSAMFTISGYADTSDLYIPIGYRRLTLFSALPRRCWCHIKWQAENSIRQDVVAFDLTLADADGRIIANAEEFTLRRVSSLTMFRPLTARSGSSASDRLEEQSIATDAGIAAFEKVLAAEFLPQVILAPAALEPALLAADVSAGPPTPVKPADARGDVADQLVQWWRELLGVDQVDPHDDFFDLGGQSLIALRLFSKIKHTYGVDLGLGTLFQARTIEQLTKTIRASENVDQCVVPMRVSDETTKKPIFFLHGINGEVLLYRHLVRYLAPDQPVYGLRAPDVEENPAAFASIPNMAAHYLTEVRRTQPSGPYRLSGFSYGGFVAYEMACQLRAAGEAVDLLLILDTETSSLRIQWTRWERICHWYWRFRHRLTTLAQEPRAQLIHYFSSKIRGLHRRVVFRRARNVVEQELIEWVEPERRKVAAILQKAATNYAPEPYPDRAVLFRAMDRRNTVEFDPKNGWGGLVKGGLVIHEFNGGHLSMMRDPCAQEVAARLTELLG